MKKVFSFAFFVMIQIIPPHNIVHSEKSNLIIPQLFQYHKFLLHTKNCPIKFFLIDKTVNLLKVHFGIKKERKKDNTIRVWKWWWLRQQPERLNFIFENAQEKKSRNSRLIELFQSLCCLMEQHDFEWKKQDLTRFERSQQQFLNAAFTFSTDIGRCWLNRLLSLPASF